MSDIKSKLEVPSDKMRVNLDGDQLKGLDFNKITPCTGIIGQSKAIAAVEQGLQITSKGYNIFVTGQPGTGRTTAVKLLLSEIQDDVNCELQDICYVNNFSNEECPRVLCFSAGKGRKFKKAIGYLMDTISSTIPKIFTDEDYREKRSRIRKQFDSMQKEMFLEFEKELKDTGFVLVQIQFGQTVRPELQPVIDGEATAMGELEKAVSESKFPSETFEKLREEYERLFVVLQETSKASKKVAGNLEEELERLDLSMVLPLINDKIETIKNIYQNPKTHEYLDELHEVLIELLHHFRPGGKKEVDQEQVAGEIDYFSQFDVNLLIDNSFQKGCPIIIEDFPTFKNLFGSIEQQFIPSTGWQTDFMRIRSGSIIRANGGYLVINAADLFQDPLVWPALKRTLRTGRLVIANNDTLQMRGSGLKPEAIDLDVKVVLIGESRIYNTLMRGDDEFKKVFKIKAEFDSVMDNDQDGINQYSQFVKKIVNEGDLLTFDRSGMIAMAEFGVKLSGRKDRLSTRFTKVADLIRESSWLAGKENKKEVTRAIVEKAQRFQENRVNLTESKIHEMYEREIYLIDVSGWQVGQINGLAVYDLGEHSFGRPNRITAAVSPGSDGVINIEREAAMSGSLHDKGVLILSGFMRQRFGRDKPIVFTASLCFEQSYSGVDGDSASSTEIYALLSALSDKPINQSLAVTGSVNQKGEIQPIGGVNEKIEGYYDVCMINGLNGEQGVLIPIQNVSDLMLKPEVRDAVKAGQFHVYAISCIDEGIELLTGTSSGSMEEDGNFPKDSINYLAARRLAEMAEIWKDYIR